MNSLRSRTRLRDSCSSSSEGAEFIPRRISAETSRTRLRPLRDLAHLLFVVILVGLFLPWTIYHGPRIANVLQNFSPSPERFLGHIPLLASEGSHPPPVPIIYRDFLERLSSKPDKVKKTWPPRVTRIPTSEHKYLLLGYIGEQESKARIHFMDILRLARTLDRILVLPNVGQSRLGMCREYPFDFYYDTDYLEGVIAMDDFALIANDEDRMNAQLVRVGKKAKAVMPPCMPNVDMSLHSVHLDSSSNVTLSLHTLSSDVLIVNWDLRHSIYPSASQLQLQYAPFLHALADEFAPQGPYVMVHWRMETVPPAGLVSCAQALIEAILATGITTVCLASDYPLPISLASKTSDPGKIIHKSSTFREFGDEHRQAIAVLLAEPRFQVLDLTDALGRARLEEDPGVLGILDKLVGIKADFFLSGGKGCGRASSFTKQIVQARKQRWLNDTNMLNVVDRFGFHPAQSIS